jgi:CheY-like chemotaxis protein
MDILLLDDNQHRITFFQSGLKQHKLTVCRHASAAIKAIKTRHYDLIFLDHDLDDATDLDDENSGSEVARFIADHDVQCGSIILHSENRLGRESMESILGKCQSIPYGKLKKWDSTAF